MEAQNSKFLWGILPMSKPVRCHTAERFPDVVYQFNKNQEKMKFLRLKKNEEH